MTRVGSTFVCVYLVLKQEDKVLLSLRRNTGFGDGFYGLVCGHVEDGESALSGMIREAKEEAGIDIDPADLRAVHTCHWKSNRLNMVIFFECTRWSGLLHNQEPDKCSELKWFDIKELPNNILYELPLIFDAIAKGEIYSEIGFESPVCC